MSSSSDIATDESVRKTHLDVSETRLPRQFELDGMHDEAVDDSYHGQFTRNDRRDMGRMGKVQELKVGTVPSIRIGTPLNLLPYRGISAPSPP